MSLKFSKTILVISCLASLSSCKSGDFRENLGLKKTAPDEFMVLSRPPLSMPPEFVLRAPSSENQVGIRDSNVKRKAKNSVYSGSEAKARKSGSLGELNLLKKTNANKVPINIRETIAKETDSYMGRDEDGGSIIKSLLHTPQDDPVIDADKEKQRIVESKKAGKEITGDGAEIIEPDNSMLHHLLNKDSE